jgi:hypothetical protein
MAEQKRLTTRRGALGRLLGVALGAAGVGALAEAKTSAGGPALAGPELTLYVTHMRQTKVGPADSATAMPFGAVADQKGRQLGWLHTAPLDSTGGAMTIQTFELEGGTIVGIGSGDAYVVVGSTGRYATVAGAYSERSAARLPGRQFTFTLREVSHGS